MKFYQNDAILLRAITFFLISIHYGLIFNLRDLYGDCLQSLEIGFGHLREDWNCAADLLQSGEWKNLIKFELEWLNKILQWRVVKDRIKVWPNALFRDSSIYLIFLEIRYLLLEISRLLVEYLNKIR